MKDFDEVQIDTYQEKLSGATVIGTASSVILPHNFTLGNAMERVSAL